MPELPEVETIARDLRALLSDRTIRDVRRTSNQKLRRTWSIRWHPCLVGRRITGVERRGKWLVVVLQDDQSLLVHLGMSGQLTVVSADEPLATHTHIVLDLDDGRQLRFRDIRRFGCAVLVKHRAARDKFFEANKLGPEPFDLDPKWWRNALARTIRDIKAVLLDQSVVVGIGNIYADEALFQARLHPALAACELTRMEADRLRESIATVLTRAIERRGSTIRNYVGGSGLAGGFQQEFRVYGRTGEPCTGCRTPIAVERIAGRSSHFCPNCQTCTADRPRPRSIQDR